MLTAMAVSTAVVVVVVCTAIYGVYDGVNGVYDGVNGVYDGVNGGVGGNSLVHVNEQKIKTFSRSLWKPRSILPRLLPSLSQGDLPT